jgi:hypothetical protein
MNANQTHFLCRHLPFLVSEKLSETVLRVATQQAAF